MELNNDSDETNIVDDMFIEICKELYFSTILNLQLLSTHHKSLIRRTYWRHCLAVLKNTTYINEKVIYFHNNYHFMKYYLSGCKNITDESIKLLGKLHTLYLSNCYNITDESVKCLGNLHILNLSFCNKITDESVKCLDNLYQLELYYCNKITNESVKYLKCKGVIILK